MRKRVWKRVLGLAAALCLICAVSVSALAADTYDGAAFGEWRVTAETRDAWVNRSISTSEMQALLNSQTLYPQRTGWDKLDNLLESMLSGFGSDTYSQLRGMYDWLVKNVTYSWEGYSNTTASAAAYDSVTGYDYLSSMTYEDGLEKSIPDDMANRTYHILTQKKGVCYDYAIAMAVTARYIGIDSYVRTGGFNLEDGGICHHGWTILILDGTEYIFDSQRDARNWEYYGRNGYYFGFQSSGAVQYFPNYWYADTQANAARDASMLSVTADRVHKVTLTVRAEAGGTASGTGTGLTGSEAEFTAVPDDGYVFSGWYDESGKRVSSDNPYIFTITDDVALTARFAKLVSVTVRAEAGGTASGSGTYMAGTPAAVRAVPDSGAVFLGWYDADGNLISLSASYTFTITDDTALTARFGYTLSVIPSRSGSASGSGDYMPGTEVSLTAGGAAFSGWYDEWGNFLSDEPEYTIELNRSATIYALFDGDVFCDISSDDWYMPYVMDCAARGLVNGTTAVTFSGDMDYSRAMAAVMLARLEDADTASAEPAPFADVPQDTWYSQEVNWAYASGVVQGRSEAEFDPEASVTRQEFLTMIIRYLEGKGYELEEAELDYLDADEIDDWALESLRKAQSIGLIEGNGSGEVMPKGTLSRAEGATILSRLAQYLDDNPLPEDEAEDESETPADEPAKKEPEQSDEPEFSEEPADEPEDAESDDTQSEKPEESDGAESEESDNRGGPSSEEEKP